MQFLLLPHKLTVKTKGSYTHMNYQRTVPLGNVPRDYNSASLLVFHMILFLHRLVLQNFRTGFAVRLYQHWRRADSNVRQSMRQSHIHNCCSVDIASLHRAVPSCTRLNLDPNIQSSILTFNIKLPSI